MLVGEQQRHVHSPEQLCSGGRQLLRPSGLGRDQLQLRRELRDD
jgi:hypothetical protein